MANEDLLLRIGVDSTSARAEAAKAKAAIVGEMKSAAAQISAQGREAGQGFNDGFRRASDQAIQGGLVKSLQSAQREGDGLFNVLTQLRIGLTQLGRGDIGGIPNLIKAYREFSGVGSEAKRAVQLLDATLVASGASATKAAHLTEEFGLSLKKALSGAGRDADLLRADFDRLGISLAGSLLNPDKSFVSLLRSLGSAKAGSAELASAFRILGVEADSLAGKSLLSAGKALNALGDSGSSLQRIIVGLGAGFAALLITVVAVGAAIFIVVQLIQGMIARAKEIGTKSKDDFEAFKKAVQSAGFEVTNLDRALSQSIVKSVNQIKGVTDGLFVELIRTSGPALRDLLKTIAGLMKDLSFLGIDLGVSLQSAFLLANAALQSLRDGLQLLAGDINSLVKLVFIAVTQGIGGVLVAAGQNFIDNFGKAVKAGRVKNPLEGFGDHANSTAEQASKIRLKLLELEARAAQRTFNETTAAAERSYKARGITAEEFTTQLILAEAGLRDAKLRIIEAEREEIDKGLLKEGNAQIKKEELRQRELDLLSDYKEKVTKLRDDLAQKQSDAINRTLDDSRKVFAARQQLLRDLAQIQNQIKQAEIEGLQITADQLSRDPGRQGEALEARLRVKAEQERQRHTQALEAIEQERADNVLSSRDSDEKLKIDIALHDQQLAEVARFRAAMRELRIGARIEQLEQQGFDPAAASAIAVIEEEKIKLLGRQLTLWEKLKIAVVAYSQTLQQQADIAWARAANVLGNIQHAAVAASNAFVDSAGSLKAAGRAFAQALIAPYIEAAKTRAAWEIAEAVASFAIGDFAGGAKHLGAAALFAALGAAGQALSNAVGGSGGAQSGALGNQLTGTRQDDNARSTEDRIRYRDNFATTQFIVVTIKTDQAQQIKNVEQANSQSYASHGGLKQILDNHTDGIPIRQG